MIWPMQDENKYYGIIVRSGPIMYVPFNRHSVLAFIWPRFMIIRFLRLSPKLCRSWYSSCQHWRICWISWFRWVDRFARARSLLEFRWKLFFFFFRILVLRKRFCSMWFRKFTLPQIAHQWTCRVMNCAVIWSIWYWICRTYMGKTS